MYFPPKFNLTRAIELLELVNHAYSFFEAYKNKKVWVLPAEYTMIKELSYGGTGMIFQDNNFFDRELQGLLKSFGKKSTGIPIGFIARQKHDIFIIFRGTMTSREWIRNLNTGLKSFPNKGFGKVHEGFLQMYEVVRNDIEETLRSCTKIKRIFIAGHSLGGAMATLLAPDASEWKPDAKLSVHTYGSPRLGDNKFVEAYNRKFSRQTFRIANTSDLVVSMPLPAEFMGFIGGYFSHVDTPVDFTIQKNDIDKNHEITLYSGALKEAHQPWGFFRRFFR